MPGPHGVSVVVPVYKTSGLLWSLVGRIHAALGDVDHEIVLVDDGSPGATWDAIEAIAATDERVVGLRLGRNSGQHSALLAGTRQASYPITVTLDDDLQNPPEEIPRLVEALSLRCDVVYGTPIEVEQKSWRRAVSLWARRLISSTLGAPNARRMTSFRAFRTSLRDGFSGDLGPSVSLDALLAWSTDQFGEVLVEHHPRAEETSSYSLRKLVRHAIDTASGYSALPLQVATGIGFVTSIFGLLVLAWAIGRTILAGGSVPGFPFLASIIAIFSGAQLLTLGIIGEYLARMHFRIMRKPTYVVADSRGGRHAELNRSQDDPL